MLTPANKALMTKQGYRIIGNHSAVKTCGWTKNLIKGKGGCYKLKFYGIMSHQCLQMTTSISCANRCTFCWRDYKAPVAKDWHWPADDPQLILDGSIQAHHALLIGFKGNPAVNRQAYEQSLTVRHVALSLTGEPIMYPLLNELLDLFNSKGISTFLVTNAQYPDQIRDLSPVTQLYISLDAPNKELLKQVDKPLFPDYWERLLKSLDHMCSKPERTCIRLTLIKHINMVSPEQYAELIRRAEPDFLEIKAYMFVGASRERLQAENMPTHEEVVAFTQDLMQHLPEYAIVSEHIPSRVVMAAKQAFRKDRAWHTWIDFDRWHELVLSRKPYTAQDYIRPTPRTGLSGKGTKEHLQNIRQGIFVDEHKPELELFLGKDDPDPEDC